MEIVDVWLIFGELIHQDFLDDYPDVFSGLLAVFNGLNILQREELYSFLTDLMAKNPTPWELHQVWEKSGAGFYVFNDQREFFCEMLRLFGEALGKSDGAVPTC